MEVRWRRSEWNDWQNSPASLALTPRPYSYDGGVAENARDAADAAAAAVGRLLETLVEKGVLTLGEAALIAGERNIAPCTSSDGV